MTRRLLAPVTEKHARSRVVSERHAVLRHQPFSRSSGSASTCPPAQPPQADCSASPCVTRVEARRDRVDATGRRGYARRVSRTLPAWLRKPSARLVDAAVAAAVGLAVLRAWLANPEEDHGPLLGVVFAVAVSAPLLVRRRWPFRRAGRGRGARDRVAGRAVALASAAGARLHGRVHAIVARHDRCRRDRHRRVHDRPAHRGPGRRRFVLRARRCPRPLRGQPAHDHGGAACRRAGSPRRPPGAPRRRSSRGPGPCIQVRAPGGHGRARHDRRRPLGGLVRAAGRRRGRPPRRLVCADRPRRPLRRRPRGDRRGRDGRAEGTPVPGSACAVAASRERSSRSAPQARRPV